MDLSETQKESVKSWIADGAGLSDVQDRMAKEFGITMTYMDVRFLVDDLGAELKDTEVPQPQPSVGEAATADMNSVDGQAEPAVEDPDVLDFDQEVGGSAGAVRVEVDRLQRPGAVVSGSVTFSDGVQATWQIDQMGRLGIVPPQEGYQPTAEDIQEFQIQLQQVLQKQGF